MESKTEGLPPRSTSAQDDGTVFRSQMSAAVRPGTRLNGIYEIESLIGEGGMGKVYKGFNLQTGDPVAIKMIRSEHSRDADAMALFKREAATLHKLQHEAIVRYYLFSIDPTLQCAYLAMEFVDGVSLTRKLGEGPLSLAETGILKSRVAASLDVAHRLGVVHRDISSDNLVLPGGDVRQAKIIDFGIARKGPADPGTIIGTGFAGKYRYVSPEQLQSGEVTAKSDIYSFGLVLAEALRGRPLDMGNSPYEAVERRRAVPDLTEVDPSFRPLLQEMLQPNPADRPESMAAVAAWVPSPEPRARNSGRGRVSEAGPHVPASGVWRYAAIFGVLIAAASMGTTAYVFRDDLAGLPARLAPGYSTGRVDTHAGGDATKPTDKRPGAAEASTGTQGATDVAINPPDSSVGDGRRTKDETKGATTEQPNPIDATERLHVEPPTAAQRERFLRDFGAGTCTFVRADSSNLDSMQVVSSDPSAFGRFATAYRSALAAEPKFTTRTIDDPQCAVLDLLRNAAASAAPPLRIEMDTEEVGTGKPLAGTVQGVAGRHLILLLIANDGSVHGNQYDADADGKSARFKNAKLVADGPDVGHTLAVVAIASDHSLKAVETSRSSRANEFVPKLLADPTLVNVAVDAQFVKWAP